jgi:hypothetical protein
MPEKGFRRRRRVEFAGACAADVPNEANRRGTRRRAHAVENA